MSKLIRFFRRLLGIKPTTAAVPEPMPKTTPTITMPAPVVPAAMAAAVPARPAAKT